MSINEQLSALALWYQDRGVSWPNFVGRKETIPQNEETLLDHPPEHPKKRVIFLWDYLSPSDAEADLGKKMAMAIGLPASGIGFEFALPFSTESRRPLSQDQAMALRYQLLSKLSQTRAEYVVAFGAISASMVLGKKVEFATSRGQFQAIQAELFAGNLLLTYAPRDLLKNPTYKRTAWEDLKKLMQCFSH